MCRSLFGPSGRVLHCSSKLGMLLLSMFLIYLLVFFFEYIFHCLSVKLVSCKCLLNLDMVFAFYLTVIFL